MNSRTERLLAEIPSNAQIETFLIAFFKTNKEPHYLADFNLIVADHFGLSVPAYELTTVEVGDYGTNAKSTEATVLGSRVGWVVTLSLKEQGIVKLVDVNTYESIEGKDKPLTDSPGMRAARTRAGVSDIVPSVKILRTIKRFAKDEALLISELSTKFDPKLVELAVKFVNETT